MRNPSFGEANLGAVVGAAAGAIGGLFAVGIPRAIAHRNPALLLAMPMLGLICWFVCGPVGWLLGGQIGPRLGEITRSQRGEIVGGIIGGLTPVLAFACWSWYVMRG
jgi:hypothetical protein